MTIKTKYMTAVGALMVGGLLYYFWYLGGQVVAYEDIPKSYGNYTITTELASATATMKDGKTALVYARNPQVKSVAITFDGLPNEQDAETLSSLVKTYNMPITVFAEGSTAVTNPQIIKTLSDSHIVLGNYTYVGLAYLQNEPVEVALEQLVRTQKVLTAMTGVTPQLMKAPLMEYTPQVMQEVNAAGLQGAVKTTVFVPVNSIKTDEDAARFVATIPQGAILSFVVSKPVAAVSYKAEKTYEKQAKDKQPGLKMRDTGATDSVKLVDAAERIFKALKAQNIPVVPVTDLKAVPVKDLTVSWLDRLIPAVQAADNKTTTGKAMPAAVTQVAATPVTSTQATASKPVATDVKNVDQEAVNQVPRMIYTTDPAVAFVYAGLTKPAVVHETLNFLKENHSTGTFFVNDSEIRKNPQLVKDIIASGNEVGIAIRSLKNGNYTTVRRQIDYVRTQLQSMGVSTNLMMQPWGTITADTVRAVADEKGVMYRPTVTMISATEKDFTSPDAVMADRFGKFTRSLGRGWIVFFRLDYYNDDTLAVKVMNLLKRHKIDNIAYHSIDDDPATNPHNDSSYAISSMGSILAKTNLLYSYNPDKVYSPVGTDYVTKANHDESFKQYLSNRYIGKVGVNDSNMYGFTIEEKRFLDVSGLIHTNDPVVFFTFDDFGNDSAINPLLYVLKKHNAKGTFFVLTRNIVHNPNIVRAMAADGHDVASHSEFHHAMSGEPYQESYTKYLYDYGVANAKLEDLLKGVYHSDGTMAYHNYFRPPTLTASRAGFQALYDTGYSYIVSGSYSTHDYEQPDLAHMIQAIKDGIYDKQGRLIKGAVLVMHMNDHAIFTPIALDMIMTANDRLPDGDPRKFIAMPLSAYLKDGYSQAKGINTVENKEKTATLYEVAQKSKEN